MKKLELKAGFGKVIKELRVQRGLSQQELADYSNMDRSYLSQLERGLFFPTLNVVYNLAEILEIKPHDLIQKVDKEVL